MDWETVLQFWFGPLDAAGSSTREQAARWFTRDAAFDANIRLGFGKLHDELMAGGHETWLATTRGRLATIVVLDQFSRNLFRSDGRAFAGDARARQATLEGLELGCDRELAFDERGFFYMPLMHAEDLALQERCLGLYKAWLDQLEPSQRDRLSRSLHYAQRHRDVIARFGRFPHRNHLIGRSSTGDEVAFLREAGPSL
jgi:uncharacterized protein (DUF924 family)